VDTHATYPYEITTRRAEGRLVINAWKRKMSLEQHSDVIAAANYELNVDGCMQNQYDMALVWRWFDSVCPTLRSMLHKDYGSRKRSAAVFRLGDLGSIWFDVPLTSFWDKTKKTRVALIGIGTPSKLEGFRIILDPTFDEAW
jgi:hypothetical protein